MTPRDELAARLAKVQPPEPPSWWVMARGTAIRGATNATMLGMLWLGTWGMGGDPMVALRVAIGGWACVGLPLALLGALTTVLLLAAGDANRAAAETLLRDGGGTP